MLVRVGCDICDYIHVGNGGNNGSRELADDSRFGPVRNHIFVDSSSLPHDVSVGEALRKRHAVAGVRYNARNRRRSRNNPC